jgi:hypothetical protein
MFRIEPGSGSERHTMERAWRDAGIQARTKQKKDRCMRRLVLIIDASRKWTEVHVVVTARGGEEIAGTNRQCDTT